MLKTIEVNLINKYFYKEVLTFFCCWNIIKNKEYLKKNYINTIYTYIVFGGKYVFHVDIICGSMPNLFGWCSDS